MNEVPVQEMPQPVEKVPIPCESKEQKEQREQRRRIETLKNWDVNIKFADRGCFVSVGCRSFAFESVVAAMEALKQYTDNPEAVIRAYGFGDYV